MGAVLILLPPSEAKSERSRGRAMSPERLSFPGLTATRARVAAALTQVSSGASALSVLGVSARLADEVRRNTRLATSPSVPVSELYTGVLYDALALTSLDEAARRRANRRIVVVSALYGAVRPTDRVASYRLSMKTDLPGIGPLAPAWREGLDGELRAVVGRGLIVDCRSAEYVAAWPVQPDLAHRWVAVRSPGQSHWVKQTRGVVARALCELAADPRHPANLAAALSAIMSVQLSAPARPRDPWVLDVMAAHPA